nr:hypothetical protein Itr_chr05CG21840 [Ipomoea trifida]
MDPRPHDSVTGALVAHRQSVSNDKASSSRATPYGSWMLVTRNERRPQGKPNGQGQGVRNAGQPDPKGRGKEASGTSGCSGRGGREDRDKSG